LNSYFGKRKDDIEMTAILRSIPRKTVLIVAALVLSFAGLGTTFTRVCGCGSIDDENDRQAMNASLLGYMMEAYGGRYAEYLKPLSAEELDLLEAYVNGDVAQRELMDQLNPESVSAAFQLFSAGGYQRDLAYFESIYRDHKRLTPEVDIATRNFRVPPTDKWGAIGYAVSSDLRDYVLLGTGWGKKYITLYGAPFFPLGEGVRILRLPPVK
jgi:hypothetical protein